jgi:hypothetical protein
LNFLPTIECDVTDERTVRWTWLMQKNGHNSGCVLVAFRNAAFLDDAMTALEACERRMYPHQRYLKYKTGVRLSGWEVKYGRWIAQFDAVDASEAFWATMLQRKTDLLRNPPPNLKRTMHMR